MMGNMREHIEYQGDNNMGQHTPMRHVQMLLYRTLLIAVAFCAIMISSCATDKHTAEMISHAESIVEEHPDSALRVVQSIDPSKVKGKHDRAHFQLVVAEAHYYNRITPDSQTIAQPLFDYYFTSDRHQERARAMYQYAIVMQKSGKNAEAMFALLEAEKSLSHFDNHRLAGLVHRTKGDIYGTECLFQNALEEYKMAEEEFVKAKLGHHTIHSMYCIGLTLGNLREFDAAIEYLSKAESKSLELDYFGNIYVIQIELCYNYIQNYNFDKCEEVFSRIDLSDNLGYSNCDYYCIGAILAAYKQDFDKAYSLIETAKLEPVVYSNRLNYTEYVVAHLQGKSDIALSKYEFMIENQDKTTINALGNSILNYQIDVLQQDIALITERKMRVEQQYIFTIIITIFIILIIVGLLFYKHREYRNKINYYINLIDGLELMRSDISQTELMSSTIEKLYRQSIHDLSNLCEIYYEHGNSKRLTERIATEVAQSIDALKNDKRKLSELETAVNISMDNIMQKLRKQCPSLNERDMRIALYSYAGFSNRAISLLVGVNSETLPKIKYKIRECIKQSNSPDAEILILPLIQKKR